ncbi:MAG: SH3 domain-containing protein, partial [Clostridia bacterium]
IIKKSSGWSRVTMTSGAMRGRTGWMFNKYVLNLRDTADSSGWGALAHIKTEYATSGVNLRKGPGMSYGVKGTLHRNDMLIILDKYNSRWYEVQIGNSLRTGFVSSEYITNGAIAHTTSSVNLRRKASDSSEILNVVPSGEEVLVLNIGSKWAKVKYERRTGYIFTKYLRLK